MTRFIFILALSATSFAVTAQVLSMDAAVDHALEKHPSIMAARASTSYHAALKRAAIDFPKTDIVFMRGQFNSIVTDENITIGQVIPFPLTLLRQRKLSSEQLTSARIAEIVTRNELTYRVRQTYNRLTYLKARRVLLEQQDSLFMNLLRAVSLQYKTGEGTALATTLAETQRFESRNELEKNLNDITSMMNSLRLQCRINFQDISGTLDGLVTGDEDLEVPDLNPSQQYMQQQVKVAEQEKKLEASRMLPDVKIGYFNQTLIGFQNLSGQDVYFGSSKRFDGFQVGLSFPLWFGGFTARTKALSYSESLARSREEENNIEVAQQFDQALHELEKNKRSVTYYRESALKAARQLRYQTEIAFRNGEIDYHSMLIGIKQAIAIEEGFLTSLYNYNDNLILIQYLKGK